MKDEVRSTKIVIEGGNEVGQGPRKSGSSYFVLPTSYFLLHKPHCDNFRYTKKQQP